ncbi:GTP cyclohydrolase FolE2 [uncultured Gimesia sp.]|uniref:GTP cyclohydrolase FolE2 n=1 Tax=uncultured Gimesia sp. TaxID=1678688 RepID=UPI0030DA71CA|tara:strand:- start:124035 stop:125024 length:990 start_codon:yes stop_codon:yes gene_type:complete
MFEFVSDALNLKQMGSDAPTENSRSPLTTGLPDVANETVPQIGGTLDRVGMSGVELVLRLRDASGEIFRTPARADAAVSLDDEQVKGIHMSRLFLSLNNRLADAELSLPLVNEILKDFVQTHQEMSSNSYLTLSYEHSLKRPALLSDHAGWRAYPIRIHSALQQGEYKHQLSVRLTYSSACPCSAALSRQLIQQAFEKAFRERSELTHDEIFQWLGTQEAILAVPHSQRSHADVTVELDSTLEDFPIESLIDYLERVIVTPVQTAVKREDEQEFARLNGANLMFCEDAARKLKAALEEYEGIKDFRVEINHLESLHPHDAAAVATRNSQ